MSAAFAVSLEDVRRLGNDHVVLLACRRFGQWAVEQFAWREMYGDPED